MTKDEFAKHYKALRDAFPKDFGSDFREMAIAKTVMDLDSRWFGSLVNRILTSGNSRLDIAEAARNERISRKRIQETEDLIAFQKKFNYEAANRGYQETLNKLGAKSLVDAVFKTKQPKGEQ